MRRSVGWLLAIVALLAAALAGSYLWASSGWDGLDPRTAGHAEVVTMPVAPHRVLPSVLKVMTWNVAFGGGANGASTDVYRAEEVRANLAALASQIRQRDPDLVFLQEVDRPSSRTGNVDQFQTLLNATGFPYGCFVTTWKLNYLPFPYWPPSKHIGRIHSGQAILSRFPIESCERRPLPQPAEQPSWYNRSFLHRCLQLARVRLAPDRFVQVVNVHLEAFSQPNREAQAKILADLVAGVPAPMPLIVAGDFNSVPPNAARKSGFPDEDTDFATDRTIEIVRSGTGLREVFLDDMPEAPDEATLTYPSKARTRRLDYVFSRGMGASTQRGALPTNASDHRAVEAVLPLGVAP